MNSLTEVVPAGSTVSRETISKRFFKICYLTAITVSTIGWVSALWRNADCRHTPPASGVLSPHTRAKAAERTRRLRCVPNDR
jgi:hypothetical protein